MRFFYAYRSGVLLVHLLVIYLCGFAALRHYIQARHSDGMPQPEARAESR